MKTTEQSRARMIMKKWLLIETKGQVMKVKRKRKETRKYLQEHGLSSKEEKEHAEKKEHLQFLFPFHWSSMLKQK